MSSERRAEIAANLAEVRRRIDVACGSAGRSPAEVTLTVVTKFFPADDVRHLWDLGVRDVGENRHQEAAAKAAETEDLPLRWHFVGGLQSNKAGAVARYADVVESVDRAKLLPGLARGARERGTVLDCLVQVSLDPPGGAGRRSGVDPAGAADLASEVHRTEGLRLRGVMGVAHPDEDPAAAFRRLADVAREVVAVEPGATWISAGMSGDLEQAVGAGATHVRVGSAVLGERPTIK